MENKIAVLSIIVDNTDSVDTLNSVLHDYGEFILGRMGLPYLQRKFNIIVIVIDSPKHVYTELEEKIRKIGGVSTGSIIECEKNM